MSSSTSCNRQFAESLVKRADKLVQQSHWDDAMSLYYQCLILRSNSQVILSKISQIYLHEGQVEEARLCQLGVVPDAGNERFYDSCQLAYKKISVEESQSTKVMRVSKSENVELQPPICHGRDGTYNQFNRPHTDCRGTLVSTSSQSEVWFDGLHSLVVDADRNILQEHIKGNAWLAWRATSTSLPTHLSGRVCFIDARSSSIYYHWMLDVIPKLHIVLEAGIALDTIDKFVVRATSEFQLTTLKHFGIPKEKVYFEDNYTHVTADEMIVPLLKNDLGDRVYTGLGVGMASWVPEFLRTTFVDLEVRQSCRCASKRLYITRKDATSRRLINESEILPILSEYGFEICEFEGISVPEQAKLMYEAECIVAPHGAGLTNLAFCQRGSRLLEIFGDYIVPCYWSVANLVGLEYHYFMADPVEPEAVQHANIAESVAHRRAKDIFVEPTAFRLALKSLCREVSATESNGV